MTNFYLRSITSLFLIPIFLYCLYEKNFFFYLILLLICGVAVYEIKKNVKQQKITYFLYFIILLFIYSLHEARGLNYESYIMLVWIILIVWMSDIGGYVVGKLIGGPAFSKFSPNKTISGLFGSIIFSQFSIIYLIFFLQEFKIHYYFFLIQIIFSVTAICGDIFFSYIKRMNKLKDYSNIIPGHGGVLDRIDGMIFVVILYYFTIMPYVK